MPEFEKDFMMRQVKDMAKALEKFMDTDDIDNLVKQDEKQADENKSYKDYKEELDKKVDEELEQFVKDEKRNKKNKNTTM